MYLNPFMKSRFIVFVCFISLNILFGCSSSVKKESIIVATAANMQFVMEELALQFSKQYQIECDIVVGSSGKLTAQIIEGAPYNIMVSADMKYPNLIDKHQLGLTTPRVYAKGKLVLWSNLTKQPTLEDLTLSDVEYIAIANPKTAPYGRAAVEVLKHFYKYTAIEDKLVFGESITQTNQFITSGVAQLGFTAKSVVQSPRMKNKGKWIEMDHKAYKPIEQGIIVLKQEEIDSVSAMKFYNFMFSETAKEILIKFGYAVSE